MIKTKIKNDNINTNLLMAVLTKRTAIKVNT